MLQDRKTLLLVIAVASVGLLAMDRLIISPLATTWKERSRRIAELQTDIHRGRSLLERESVIRDRWAEMKATALPASEATAESQVLKGAHQWRTESAIRLTSIKPDWRDHEDGHRTLECRVTGIGSINTIARFLYRLETDPLALRVEQIEIARRGESTDKLTLNLHFSALRLTDIEP